MARPSRRQPEEEAEFLLVEELPPVQSTTGNAWIQTLTPLLVHKGQWARVKVFDDPGKAHGAQSNLTRRKSRIPQPSHDWGFAARGCELFAIYRGPFKASGAPLPRRTRKPVSRKKK